MGSYSGTEGDARAETERGSVSDSRSRLADRRGEGVWAMGADRQGNCRVTFRPWNESAKLFFSYHSTSWEMFGKHLVVERKY